MQQKTAMFGKQTLRRGYFSRLMTVFSTKMEFSQKGLAA